MAFGIQSGILFGTLSDILFAFDLTFYLASIWPSIWPSIWLSIWHSIWHTVRHDARILSGIKFGPIQAQRDGKPTMLCSGQVSARARVRAGISVQTQGPSPGRWGKVHPAKQYRGRNRNEQLRCWGGSITTSPLQAKAWVMITMLL